MIVLSPEAEAHVDRLIEHYEAEGTASGVREFVARHRTGQGAHCDLAGGRMARTAPLHPSLARHGRRWIVEGRYWISYSLTTPR